VVGLGRTKFVKIRAIRVYEFDLVRDDSCNSCPKFVAISVIGVYDAGAVTNG
jgi:hypothetical protein